MAYRWDQFSSGQRGPHSSRKDDRAQKHGLTSLELYAPSPATASATLSSERPLRAPPSAAAPPLAGLRQPRSRRRVNQPGNSQVDFSQVELKTAGLN